VSFWLLSCKLLLFKYLSKRTNIQAFLDNLHILLERCKKQISYNDNNQRGGEKMGGCCCPSNVSSSSPILFFATSTEANQVIVGAGENTVLMLGVSPPSPGSHQVKLDSTVELLLDVGVNPNYDILYRLRRSDLVSPLATLQISRRFTGNVTAIYTEIPNLTWNDLITNSVTYTVTIQVVTNAGVTSVTAQTRALNTIVF
jgi:hypothetical protein